MKMNDREVKINMIRLLCAWEIYNKQFKNCEEARFKKIKKQYKITNTDIREYKRMYNVGDL